MHSRSARLLLSAAQLVRPLLVPPSSVVPRGMMMRWSAARAVMTASGDTEVSLFYERPLRDFLSGGSRRKERLSLPSDQPFETLRQAVYKRLDADVPLELKHGKRVMSSDDDLRAVLTLTQSRDVEVMIRVAAAPGAELPPPPPPPPSLPPVSGPMQMLSFFQFRAFPPHELSPLQARLEETLRQLNARGTVYLAPEVSRARLGPAPTMPPGALGLPSPATAPRRRGSTRSCACRWARSRR